MTRRRRLGPFIAAALLALLGAALLVASSQIPFRWFERHVLTEYCVRSPADDQLIVICRRVIGSVGVICLLLAPLLWRWLSRASRERIIWAITSASLATVAALGTTEWILRRAEARAKAVYKTWDAHIPKLNRGDPSFGWRWAPSQTLDDREGDHVAHYVIGADRNRVRSIDDRPDPALPTLLVVGESVGFGHGMDYDETFAARLGEKLGLQVVNLSVHGYAQDQQLLRLRDQLPRFSDPKVVLILFLPTQVGRAQLRDRVHLTLDNDGRLITEPSSERFLIHRLVDGEPYHDQMPLEVTRAALRAQYELARSRGAKPIFLVTNFSTPCRPDPDVGMPWIVWELFEREHLPYVRVEIGPGETVSTVDQHPNAAKARRIADAVEAGLRSWYGAP